MLCISMPPSSVKFDQRVGVAVEVGDLSPPKRPKLSLQTTVCDRPRSFGKSSTSLMLATSSGETDSPTINNTYFNAYHAPRTPTTTTNTSITFPSPMTTVNGDISRTSTLRTSEDPKPPYTQPLGIRSILRNGPLPRPTPRNASSRQTHPRPRFPAPKRVWYRTPLWEEIRTSRYTVAHFDLVLLEWERKDGTVAEDGKGVQCAAVQQQEEEEDKDKDSDGAGNGKEGEAYEGGVGTPLSPRKRGKQKREWSWTLASPVQQGEQDRETRTAVEKPHG